MRLFYCDHYAIPLPAGHKFPMRKYRMVRDRLAAAGFVFDEAPFAAEADIAAAHDPGYVRAILDGSVDPGIIRRIGFPWSEGLVRRTLASVGGTLAAARDAVERGFGGNLAGGTHHAFHGEGAGFCVFNDIAVGVAWLRKHRGVKRVSVIDLDVHQGDGTAAMLGGDPAVYTLSVHGRNNFPFRKQRSTVDVELDDCAGDDAFLDAVAREVPRAIEFGPDVVFFQSGVDALTTDRLGKLAVSPEGMAARDRIVFEACYRAGVPVVTVLGGGYSEPIEATADAHARTFQMARMVFG